MSGDQNGEQNLYRNYLEQKHSRFNTPSEVVDSVVKKAIGLSPVSRKKLVLGEVNEVYDLQTDGQEVIVRISRSKHPRFYAEKWAIDQCRQVGVPAPNVFLIERAAANNEQLTLCVEEKLPGEPLDNLLESPFVNEDWKKEIVKEAGFVLANIHSVKTQGYGSLDQDGKGLYDSWGAYILETAAKRERLMEASKNIGLDFHYIEEATRILEGYKEMYRNVDSRLMHGDYGPKHILVSENKISGIIDFEGCKAGDIARDFAWWEYFRGDTLPVNWLIEGYEKTGELGENFELRMQLCLLSLGLTMVDYYEHEHNTSGINHAKAHLVTDLNRFNKT